MPRGMGNRKWEIQDGKPVIVTPAVEAKVEQMPVKRLDREIERTGRRKEQVKAQLDQVQAEYDELVTHEEELKALREQITD